MSVYDGEAFQERVNYATQCILQNRGCTRAGDTCFEMYDGDIVVVALMRKAAKSPELALAIERYVNRGLPGWRETAARYAHVPARGLAAEARKLRALAEEQNREQHAAEQRKARVAVV